MNFVNSSFFLARGDIDNMGAEINVTLISEARGSSTILWCGKILFFKSYMESL